MPRYILTDHAKSDVREISAYIRRESPQNAKKVATEIREAMRNLTEFPYMGHRRDDAEDDGLRFWPVYSFLIVYRLAAKPLRVIRVIHGAQDIKKSLWRNQ